MTHPSIKYAEDVLSGDILACRWTKLAGERFLYDFENQEKLGIYFDEEEVDRVLRFYALCPHFKGEWAGTPIILEPWQIFIIANIFGWKWKDSGYRRFKVIYNTVARKNGKTTMIAPPGLYLMMADGEPGAEIYSAAVDRDQAREIFDAAKAMVEMGELSRAIKTFSRNMCVESTRSKFEPLSADEKKQHGKNIHAALCDELHVWPKASLWSVLRTGMGSRRQPIQWAITTAGSDQNTICYEIHDYAQRVLKGFKDRSFVDDTFFGIIYCLDRKQDWPKLRTEEEFKKEGGVKEDDWRDPKVWIKANPNLGISVKLKDLEDEARTAMQMSTSQNAFLRLRMNIWTQQVTRWIDLQMWDENFTKIGHVITANNKVDWEKTREKYRKRFCAGGIDLSSVDDFTCVVYLFPYDDDREKVDVLMRTWCPEDKIWDTKNKYKEQYQAWAREGWLHVTEGNAVDYDHVRKEIVEDSKVFNMGLIGVDRQFQGIGFTMDLEKDLGHTESNLIVMTCTNHPTKIGPICQEFERRLLKRKINHGGNPILRFMIDSVAIRIDADGNKKPDKDKSQGKIDGVMGMLYALDRLMRSKPKPKIKLPMSI